MRRFKDYLLLLVKGIGMGAADVIPGVSGGTIAFITNIYEELINSLKSINVNSIKLLFRGQIKKFWSEINGNFLLAVFGGVIISLVSLARLFHYLLVTHPIQLWSFFFGLILISSLWVFKKIDKWSISVTVGTIVGIVSAYLVTSATPAATPESPVYVFFSGAIAICAMILPGISGSFILLIMGKYQYILGALKDFDLVTIGIFILGCITGLLSFVRVVSWCLSKFHNVTISVLAGFMLGSLYKIWPWKLTLSFQTNSKGEQIPLLQENLKPTEYLAKTGNDPHILSAIFFLALGIIIVVALEKLANYIQERKKYA